MRQRVSQISMVAIGMLISGCAIAAWSQAPARESGTMSLLRGQTAADGIAVLLEKGCTNCHTFDNLPTLLGPDLGSDRVRGKSPSALTAALWNQAPSMWREIGESQVPEVDLREAAALYAFFYSQLYFEDELDSGRGEGIFRSRCSRCHDLEPGASSDKPGTPAATWGAIKDPLALIARMWNHSTDMLDRALRQGQSWRRLSGQDARNLLAYLWQLPELVPVRSSFRFGDDAQGRIVFNEHCVRCHALERTRDGRVDLSGPLREATVLQMAASMWNHAPEMIVADPGTRLPVLSETQTRDLATYLVIGRAFSETGDVRSGESVYRRKNCGSCHDADAAVAGAPLIHTLNPPFDAVQMTSSIWRHGPKMLETMRNANLRWPEFRPEEMRDLIAYLNARAGR